MIDEKRLQDIKGRLAQVRPQFRALAPAMDISWLITELEQSQAEKDAWKAKAEVARSDFMEIRTRALTAQTLMERDVLFLASEAANRTAEWAAPQSEKLSFKIRAEKAEASLAQARERVERLSVATKRAIEQHCGIDDVQDCGTCSMLLAALSSPRPDGDK